MKTRLSVIGIALLLTSVLAPGPKAAGPQAAQTPQTQAAPRPEQNRGQGPARRIGWWKDPEVMKAVGISADLSKKIDDLFHKRLPEAMALDREFKKQNEELNRLLKERTAGADVIAVQVDRVEAQRTTLNKTRTLMIYQMYQLLSAEQYAKLVAFNEQRRNSRGHNQR